MWAAAVLLTYAVVVTAAARRLLGGGDWTSCAPRLAIALWQAVGFSAVGSVALAGVVLASAAGGGVAEFFHACVATLGGQYRQPEPQLAAAAGVLLAAGTGGRIATCLFLELRAARRARLRQLRAISLVARPCPGRAALVLDHAVPAAYCLPGRRPVVVVTSGALHRLQPAELDAVLAHEVAHIRGRHHLLVATSAALTRAFPIVSVFAAGHAEVVRLVELIADDAALRRHDRITLAHALLALAGDDGAPASTLAAGGAGALARMHRLLNPVRPLGTWQSIGAALVVTTLLVAPLLIAILPGFAVLPSAYCPAV